MNNWINNMKLSTKLYVVLIVAALAIGISNTFLIQNINTTAQQLEKELYDELYYSTLYLLGADRDLYQTDQAFMSFQTGGEVGAEKAERLKQEYEENIEQVKERMTLARNVLLADNGLNHSEIESYIHEFFDRFSNWENETRQILSQEHPQIPTAQIESLRDEFENTRHFIDLIQEDLEVSALHTIESIQNDNQMSIMISLAIVGICLIAVFVLGFLLIRSIVNPVTKLVHVFQQVSGGNLQVEQLRVHRNDEIGQLASASNMMVDHLRSIVQKIQHISQSVSSQSEELTQSANEVRSGAEQVAMTMEQLSAGAEEQASSSAEISSLIEQLNQQVRQSNEDGKTLESYSQEVYQSSNDGKEEMGHSVKLMNQITSMVTNSVDKVKLLDQRSEEISKLIVVIQDIAEQTNLLALNAAIEAARAGDSGKGFAVVADEVRKLAEQVRASVTEISGIIEGIKEETKSMVDSLEEGYQKVEEGNQQIHVSRDSFESINQAVSDMIGRIQNVSSRLTDMATTADKVNLSVTEIASASEEAAAGIEQSSATAQQQSSSMHEIAGNAQSLSKLSEELNGMIKQFRV